MNQTLKGSIKRWRTKWSAKLWLKKVAVTNMVAKTVNHHKKKNSSKEKTGFEQVVRDKWGKMGPIAAAIPTPASTPTPYSNQFENPT